MSDPTFFDAVINQNLGTLAESELDHLDITEPDHGVLFSAVKNNFLDEDLSISSLMNREPYRERNEIIRNHIKEGTLTPGDISGAYETNVLGNERAVDWDYLAHLLNDKYGENILTDKELWEDRREDLRAKREYKDRLWEASSTAQKVFVGTPAIIAGAMHDPINWLGAMAFPTKAWQSMSLAGRVAAAGGINVLTESAIQPLVYQHKQDIESPYGLTQALTNIAMAGIGGAALEGVSSATVFTLRQSNILGSIKNIKSKIHEGNLVQGDQDIKFALDQIDRLEKEIKELPVTSPEDDILNLARELDDTVEKVEAWQTNKLVEEIESEVMDVTQVAASKTGEEPDILVSQLDLSPDELKRIDTEFDELIEGDVEYTTPSGNIDLEGTLEMENSKEAITNIEIEEKRLRGLLDCLRG